MTDTANMMGAFPFVSAVMNHNKAVSVKKMQPW
jgi:DNA polymerase-3 subunit alpha